MIQPGWPRKLGYAVERIALGDLTGDGSLEVAVDASASRLFVLAANGSTMPGWPKIDALGIGLSGVADIDADGQEEIIFASDREVRAYEEDGSVSPEWPLVLPDSIRTAALGDVDGDGAFDLILYTGQVGAIQQLHRFEIEHPVAGGWLQVNVDATNARRYRRGIVATSIETPPPLAHVLHLDVPKPNPSTSQVRFRWSQPEKGRVQLQIYSVDGRLVETLADRILEGGHHTIEWDGRTSREGRIPSGVYWVRLTSGSVSSVQKWVSIRP